MDFIKDEILSALPTLQEPVLMAVVEKLVEAGVEEEHDLQYVQESDLTVFLKPIQSRKLMSAWKAKGECVICNHINLFLKIYKSFVCFFLHQG